MTILPTYNMLLVPDADLYMRVKIYRDVTGREPEVDERVTMIVSREERARAEFTAESFYPIGLSGAIREVSPNGFLVIRTAGRVNIESVGVTPEANWI